MSLFPTTVHNLTERALSEQDVNSSNPTKNLVQSEDWNKQTYTHGFFSVLPDLPALKKYPKMDFRFFYNTATYYNTLRHTTTHYNTL